jgi:hypothetical protein
LLWLAGDIERHLWLRIVGTAAILLVLPAVYVWKLVATPPKMHLEATNKIADLTLKLDDRDQRMEICRAFGRFIESGQDVLVSCSYIGRPVPNEAADRWEEAVHKYLRENLDPIYFSRFRNWSDIPKEDFGLPSQPHEELWQAMRARLARLHQYINELRPPIQAA